MDTNKPMALRLADKYEHEGFLSDHKFAQNQWCSHAAVELRRLHAENEALRTGYDAARLEVESLKKALAEHRETLTPSNYAGVIMWAGDYRVERHLSEVEVRNCRLPSNVLSLLANSCISTFVHQQNAAMDRVIDAARAAQSGV